jgi:lipoate-protein ligase A
VSRICDALVFPSDEARETARERVLRRATTLYEALGRVITWEQAAQAVRDAFAATFALEFAEASLSPVEAQRAEELREARYSHDSWNKKI